VTWELVSSSGRERVLWTPRSVEKPADDTALVCDIELTGRFHGATLDAAPPRAGRLTGELSFVTDATCLAALCEGLRAAMASP
jgi:hypothetical protein